MKKLIIVLILGVSCVSFAGTVERILGTRNVLDYLATPHKEFLNPYCLTKYIRTESEKHDLRIAAGYRISAIEVVTTTIGFVALDIYYTDTALSLRNVEVEKETIYCKTKE